LLGLLAGLGYFVRVTKRAKRPANPNRPTAAVPGELNASARIDVRPEGTVTVIVIVWESVPDVAWTVTV